jgi:hypothetical protein
MALIRFLEGPDLCDAQEQDTRQSDGGVAVLSAPQDHV